MAETAAILLHLQLRLRFSEEGRQPLPFGEQAQQWPQQSEMQLPGTSLPGSRSERSRGFGCRLPMIAIGPGQLSIIAVALGLGHVSPRGLGRLPVITFGLGQLPMNPIAHCLGEVNCQSQLSIIGITLGLGKL